MLAVATIMAVALVGGYVVAKSNAASSPQLSNKNSNCWITAILHYPMNSAKTRAELDLRAGSAVSYTLTNWDYNNRATGTDKGWGTAVNVYPKINSSVTRHIESVGVCPKAPKGQSSYVYNTFVQVKTVK
jgi:hypothetical protein